MRGDASRARFHRHSGFSRKCDGRFVRRFRCCFCKRTVSSQTFCTSYYLKRPQLLVPIAAGLVAGSGLRQLGRSLGCSPSTVTQLSARLGRHAILFHFHALEHVRSITEPVTYDDFECFAHSQDLPLGIGTAVGHDSWFVYGLERAPHRIGGVRARRKRPRRGPTTAERNAYARSFAAILDLLLDKVPEGRSLTCYSDDHKGYQAGLASHPGRGRVAHRRFPNPERGPKGSPRTPEARRRDQAMFPTDLLHRLLRHCQAHHRRETIAFAQRHAALLERAFHLVVWRNFVKRRSERRSTSRTPAMVLGLASEPWGWPRVLAKRLFPWRVAVPERTQEIYRRDWVTPEIGRNRPHRLRYAA